MTVDLDHELRFILKLNCYIYFVGVRIWFLHSQPADPFPGHFIQHQRRAFWLIHPFACFPCPARAVTLSFHSPAHTDRRVPRLELEQLDPTCRSCNWCEADSSPAAESITQRHSPVSPPRSESGLYSFLTPQQPYPGSDPVPAHSALERLCLSASSEDLALVGNRTTLFFSLRRKFVVFLLRKEGKPGIKILD